MREADGSADIEAVACAHAPHEAAEIAETVDRDNRCFLERGGEEGAGEMRVMMLHVVDAHLVGARNAGVGERLGEVGYFDGVAGARDEAGPISRTGHHPAEFSP